MYIIFLCFQEGGKVKHVQKIYFIDDFNLPANTNLRLEKEDGTQAEYRLKPIHSNELEVHVSFQESYIFV